MRARERAGQLFGVLDVRGEQAQVHVGGRLPADVRIYARPILPAVRAVAVATILVKGNEAVPVVCDPESACLRLRRACASSRG